MSELQKARYLISPRFVELGATVVFRLSVQEVRFLTVTASIWVAVSRLLEDDDDRLKYVIAGYRREEYVGPQPLHLARDRTQSDHLRRLTARIAGQLGTGTTHFDAIVCGLLAAAGPD